MRGDDWKFLAVMAAVILLAAGLVYRVYTRDLLSAAGPTVDVEKIEKLHRAGSLSLHEADHYEVMEDKP